MKTRNIQHTILEISTKENSLQNLTRFHSGIFELEIQEIFTTAFLLKKRCKSAKNCLTIDIARHRSKTLKKEKEKRK